MRFVLIESPSDDAYFNLALEQYVFDSLDRSRQYLMLWQNDNAVIVGRYQNTAAEIDEEFVAAHQIKVARRLSGGGAVYHDLGNLNFTFVADAAGDGRLDFSLFCRPVAEVLRRLGAAAELNGRNDITVGGKKFSGNSQYVRSGRIMHHGTILFDSDLGVISRVLKVSDDKLVPKGIRSVHSRVTNLRGHLGGEITLGQFKALLLREMFGETPPERVILTPADLEAVRRLRDGRYALREWNYGSPPSGIHKRRRVEGVGVIEAFFETDGGRLASLRFFGDFFGSEDCGELAAALVGCRYEAGPLRTALAHLPVGRCFLNLTADELVTILTE